MGGDGPKAPNAAPEPPDRDDWRTTFRPDIPSSARIYDYFLGGKDNYPADRDAGLPTMGNVHEVAMAASPATRVVYVDHDPVVLAHARPSGCCCYALVARKP